LIFILIELFGGGWDRFAVGCDNSVDPSFGRALSLLNGAARWIARANTSHFVARSNE
jgi:hypothetical protein